MKRLAVLALLLIAQLPRPVHADAVCYQGAAPSPAPTTGQITFPVCVGGALTTTGGGGSTPSPFPTQPFVVNQGTSPWVVTTPAPFSGLVTQGTSPWIVNTPPPFSGLVTQGTSPWVVNTPAPFSGVVTQGTSPWVVNTPAPYPTAAVGSYLLVAPTALPTLSVTVTNVSSFPTPLAVQPVSGTVTVNTPPPFSGVVTQGTSPWIVNTPVPYPTNGSSVLKVDGSAVTQPVSGTFFQATQPVSGTVTANQGTSPWVVSTPPPLPGPTSASGLSKVVVCDPTTVTQCRTIDANGNANAQIRNGTNTLVVSASGVLDSAVCSASATCSTISTPADAINLGSGLNVNSTCYVYNTTNSDRCRSAGAGNAIASTGVPIHAAYCEFLTTLPTLTNATYGAIQCDNRGRVLTSLRPVSGTILTSASATTCTNVQSVPGAGVEIINSGPSTTVFLQVYNDAGATCAAGTLIYGDGSTIVIGAAASVKIDFPVAGIAYKLSGALTNNLSITGL
jgi:hypothetical protein